MQFSLRRSIFLFAMPIGLFALGGSPEVVSGSVRYEPLGAVEVVHVSDKAILEYQKFNLDQYETTRYAQPSSKSTLLCRIKGKDPSVIRGRLEANGKLLFVNPNGMIFSETAQIHVGTLIASTLSIRDEDFLNGRYKFTLSSDAKEASIINKGKIEADHHVVFMAAHTVNQGAIIAKTGRVVLTGGEVMTLDFDGDEKIQFAIEMPLKKGSIEQAGSLTAPEQVHMTLATAHQAIRSVLNDVGVVEAGHLEIADGVIRLMEGGRIQTGSLHLAGSSVHMEGDLNIQGSVNCVAKTISQQAPVVAAGPVHYVADQIYLGDDITTKSTITLDGPVTLVRKDAIHLTANKYNQGTIILASTLDADQPSRTLTLNNPRSLTRIGGVIGGKGPLGALEIYSGQAIFQDNIGGAAPGIVKQFHITSAKDAGSKDGVACLGSMYHTGEQCWNTKEIYLKHEGAIEFKTAGLPLRFMPDAKVIPEKTTAVRFTTGGGFLDLAPITPNHAQSITIDTGHGNAHLQEIGQKIGDHVTSLHVEGHNVLIAGQLKAGQIFIEAGHKIEYDLIKGSGVITTDLQSTGAITLNARHGVIGSAERPLYIEARGKLHVGAKTIAYIRGRCMDQYPYPYTKNPPPSIVFNAYEYKAFFFDDELENNAFLKTLTPALSKNTSTVFIDGGVLTPRNALIYYETLSK